MLFNNTRYEQFPQLTSKKTGQGREEFIFLYRFYQELDQSHLHGKDGISKSGELSAMSLLARHVSVAPPHRNASM